jgi:flagellar motor switch protein FliN/FliY
MNQMMGSSATSMSTIFNRFVNISPPGIDILDVESGEGLSNLPQVETFVKISFRLMIGDLIDSNIMQLLPVTFAKELVATLMGGTYEPEVVAPAVPAYNPAPAAPAAVQPPAAPYQAPGPPPQPAMPEQQAYSPPYMPEQQMPMGMPMMPPQGPQAYGSMSGRNVNVQPVQFGGFQSAPYVQADDTNLNLLLDIPLKVTVELGRTQKQIKEILELSQGSIIELDKLAGEPVDILINNKLIAKGEVVVIDENFGVRVTDIVSQWDRIQKLQ